MRQNFSYRDRLAGNLDKFLLLTWKNWLIQWRHPIQTVFEILAPVFFACFLVLLRCLVEPEKYDTFIFPPYYVDSVPGVFNSSYTFSRVVWSPCDNDALEHIMEIVAKKYNIKQVCKKNSKDLQKELEANMLNTFAGVDFGDHMALSDTIDKKTSVTLRFPAELRMFGDDPDPVWLTNKLFHLYIMPGVKGDIYGAIINYYYEGFLTLQHDISKEIINYHLQKHGRKEEKLPAVMMQRFPYPAWVHDTLLVSLQLFAGLIVLLSFVYSCINTVKVITDEKEKQLKEALKIIGLPTWLHWTAWFLKALVFLTISVTLIVVLVKVPWQSHPPPGHSVFSYINPLLLFVFLLFYVFAIITFCFMVSVFFSKANTAATVAGLAWFISYSPYFCLKESYNKLGLIPKLFSMLCFNSAMAYGVQLVVIFEGTGGLHWGNIFRTANPTDNLTMGHVMAMLLFDSFLHMLVTLYIEAVYPGEYGIPKVWYYPFTMQFWGCQSKSQVRERRTEERLVESDIYEKEPTNLKAGIEIRKLTKSYSNKNVVVKDLSVTMFEGQITVLLGHNGAGKTTTMSMLTGMIQPTSGTAIVNGYDIRTDMEKIRSSLGLCAQNNILYDDLSVREHLYFFSRLKGMKNKAELNSEIKKYIELLDLVPKSKARAKTLSGGMKRKLCFAIAFCGGSKICLFDEPTAGMDPAARRALWDIIQTEKKDRTILLSTHFMDEADVLGDRIAIMAAGQLQCCGTSFFLKKKYGGGYHLVMEKKPNCNVNDVTNFLRKHIQSIVVYSDIGAELTYVLPKEESVNFQKMLQDLENNADRLGISNFGISLATMEEVFMRVGTYQTQDDDKSELEITVSDEERLEGCALKKNQFIAMMMKEVLHTIRSWILLLIQILIPIIFVILAIVVSRTAMLFDDMVKLDISLTPYEHPVTVITTEDLNNSYYREYLNILESENQEIIDWEKSDMITNMLTETTNMRTTVMMRYIIGASFSSQNDTVTAWFNNEPIHSPPLALEYVMNAIFRQKMKSDEYTISILNHPLPFSPDNKILQLQQGNTMSFQIAFNVGFSMAFVTSFYILFCVKERVSKSKHLQFVSGVEPTMYWMTTYLWDLITFSLISVCLVLTLLCFQEDGFRTGPELGRFFLLLSLFAFAVLPEMYLASFLFKAPSTAYTRMTLVSILLGVAAFMIVHVMAIEALDLKDVSDALHWMFLCVPHYALCAGLQDMSYKTSINELCKHLNELVQEQLGNTTSSQMESNFACELQKVCCDIDDNFMGWDNHGILRSICFLGGIGIFLTLVLLTIEQRFFHGSSCVKRKIPKVPDESDDDDVFEEKRRVRTGEINNIDYSIVLKDLTKWFNRKTIAVNQLCLGIKGWECFGLLGINGAGKTTTFKMMTGDTSISKGEAWIYGWNVKTNIKNIHKYIGYCPQFDALIDDLTGRETMIMYCLLRGYTLSDSKMIAEFLSREFDFHRHLDKRVRHYSGGTKRKLSTAIAIIGDPPIIFLDEPTTGMDPASRRKVWNTLCDIRDSGTCLILTSHSMEECEALCTRLAIMVNGVFKCLGTTQHLKNKFSQGYTLTVKVRRPDNRELNDTDIEPIENYVRTNFPNSILRERYQDLLTFYINDKRLKWSVMFGLMEKAKKTLNIDDYSLGQCTLDQVFLSFTKFQLKP